MIKPVTGYLALDALIVIVAVFLTYVGFFTPTKAKTTEFSGGVLVYRDFVLQNRNHLRQKFDDVKEDLKDCMLDFPTLPKYPMAALF